MADKKLLMSVIPGTMYIDGDAHIWSREYELSEQLCLYCSICDKPIDVRDPCMFDQVDAIHPDCAEIDVPAKFFEAYIICASEEVIEDENHQG